MALKQKVYQEIQPHEPIEKISVASVEAKAFSDLAKGVSGIIDDYMESREKDKKEKPPKYTEYKNAMNARFLETHQTDFKQNAEAKYRESMTWEVFNERHPGLMDEDEYKEAWEYDNKYGARINQRKRARQLFKEGMGGGADIRVENKEVIYKKGTATAAEWFNEQTGLNPRRFVKNDLELENIEKNYQYNTAMKVINQQIGQYSPNSNYTPDFQVSRKFVAQLLKDKKITAKQAAKLSQHMDKVNVGYMTRSTKADNFRVYKQKQQTFKHIVSKEGIKTDINYTLDPSTDLQQEQVLANNYLGKVSEAYNNAEMNTSDMMESYDKLNFAANTSLKSKIGVQIQKMIMQRNVSVWGRSAIPSKSASAATAIEQTKTGVLTIDARPITDALYSRAAAMLGRAFTGASPDTRSQGIKKELFRGPLAISMLTDGNALGVLSRYGRISSKDIATLALSASPAANPKEVEAAKKRIASRFANLKPENVIWLRTAMGDNKGMYDNLYNAVHDGPAPVREKKKQGFMDRLKSLLGFGGKK